jgi:hypothetical protein
MGAADEVSKRWPISGEVLTLTDPIADSPHVAEGLINMTSAVGFRHCTPTPKPKERINIHDFGDAGDARFCRRSCGWAVHAAAGIERGGHGRVSRALSRRYAPYRLAAWSRASISAGVRAR